MWTTGLNSICLNTLRLPGLHKTSWRTSSFHCLAGSMRRQFLLSAYIRFYSNSFSFNRRNSSNCTRFMRGNQCEHHFTDHSVPFNIPAEATLAANNNERIKTVFFHHRQRLGIRGGMPSPLSYLLSHTRP